MGAPTELTELPATEQRRLLADRAVSATELLDAHLAVIDAVNPAVNAIIALDPDVGRGRARAVDDAIARGDDPGPLAGLVDGAQGPHRDRRLPDDVRLAAVRRVPARPPTACSSPA